MHAPGAARERYPPRRGCGELPLARCRAPRRQAVPRRGQRGSCHHNLLSLAAALLPACRGGSIPEEEGAVNTSSSTGLLPEPCRRLSSKPWYSPAAPAPGHARAQSVCKARYDSDVNPIHARSSWPAAWWNVWVGIALLGRTV